MKIENNKKIVLIVIKVLILVVVFYGGMVYGKSQIPARGQGAQAFGQNGVGGNRAGRVGNFGGLTSGQILSKDANSITVSLQGGGSKIIFLDSTTKILKSISGTNADLVNGTQVSITGTPNTDGSVNAQSVQIRPASATKPVQGAPTTQ